MFTKFKLKILYRLLDWLLGFYDPHHDEQTRRAIDATKGEVYRMLRDSWRRNFKRQTWHCNSDNHDRNCPHAIRIPYNLDVHKAIDIITAAGPGVIKPAEKKKTILNLKPK